MEVLILCKNNHLRPSKIKVHSRYLTTLTSQTSLSHTVLLYICSDTFGCSSSISLSKAGTNEAGHLCVGGLRFRVHPPGRYGVILTLRAAIVWNKPAFFPAGQTEDSPHNSHPIPGRPPEVALVWDLFEVPPAERTSLKKHCWTPPSRPAGSGARGRCALKSTTQNQGSLCAWEIFFKVCFWSWPLAGQHYSYTFRTVTL